MGSKPENEVFKVIDDIGIYYNICGRNGPGIFYSN